MIKVGIPFTDHRFPNEILRGDCMSQLVAAFILTAPACGNSPGIAVLKDTSDERLDFIGFNCVVIA